MRTSLKVKYLLVSSILSLFLFGYGARGAFASNELAQTAVPPSVAPTCGGTGQECCKSSGILGYSCNSSYDSPTLPGPGGRPCECIANGKGPTSCGRTNQVCCVNPATSSGFECDNPDELTIPSVGQCVCIVTPDKQVKITDFCSDGKSTSVSPECEACILSQGIYTSIGCIPFNTTSVIDAFFRIALMLGSALSILCITIAAIKLQFSPDKGDASGISTAKASIVSCLVGLIFMLFSVFIITILTGGVLGFKIDKIFSSSSTNVGPIPSSGPTPPISNTPNPPVPPNPGKPSNSIITPEQVEEAVRYFEALKAADNGSCGILNQNNIKNCLALVNTGVPHEAEIKTNLPVEMKKINEYGLQCAGFAKAIYMIFTGEWMYGEFNGKPFVKNLKEPFWRFTYYPLGTTTPALGDYVKWTNGPFGHVAVIVNIIDDTKFEVLQANVNVTRNRACPGCINRGPVSITEAGLAGFYRLEK